ncbi:hypothetical protein NHX12_031076 [Muraenolepis orangiensis]|uniref:Uncharacterized protein n=1 Tax=Muraenolepis orangiensis TaxID=630683 RepID=A0A9Q0E9I5_9TELE|nr:hypothetical protein NHX12_031076 [Muraenolepis orangiensis]
MFSAIARLLFGGEEKVAEDALPEAVGGERRGDEDPGSVEVHVMPSVRGHPDLNFGDDSRPSEPEVPIDHSALIRGVLQSDASRAAVLAKVTHAPRIQRAQARAGRHQSSVRDPTQSHGSRACSRTHLQQPGRRSNKLQ